MLGKTVIESGVSVSIRIKRNFRAGLDTFGGNVFVSKLDSSGNLVWAGRIGGTHLGDITLDGAGNVEH